MSERHRYIGTNKKTRIHDKGEGAPLPHFDKVIQMATCAQIVSIFGARLLLMTPGNVQI